MEKLKSCPFCGGEALLRKVPNENRYYVRCGNNECPIHVSTCMRETEEEAIEIWNRRASNDT